MHCLGGHGLQGGARGAIWKQKGPLMLYTSPPALHTWSMHPLLLCTLGSPHPLPMCTLEGAPLLLCTLGVRNPPVHTWRKLPHACCAHWSGTPACCGHFEWASRPTVPTLRVCILACCAHLECVFPASVHTWGMCSSLFSGKPPPFSARVWSGC